MSEKEPKRVFEELTKRSVILIALCASPLFFLFTYLGDQGRGRAAVLCAFVILLCARIFWSLRKRVLFWGAVVIVILYHIPFVLLIPWTSKEYPGIVLLPFVLPDFAIVYGGFKLVEMIAKKKGQSDDVELKRENPL